MNRNLTFAEMVRLLETLPPHPIAPEHRNYTRLRQSAYVARGQVLRFVLPDACSDDPGRPARPTILMHPKDVVWVAAELKLSPMVNVEQWIADACEQIFAEREARTGR